MISILEGGADCPGFMSDCLSLSGEQAETEGTVALVCERRDMSVCYCKRPLGLWKAVGLDALVFESAKDLVVWM